MAQQNNSLVGNEALQKTLELLRGEIYTRAEVDALLSQVGAAVLTYDAATRSVSGILNYDATTRSVSGLSLSADSVHVLE